MADRTQPLRALRGLERGARVRRHVYERASAHFTWHGRTKGQTTTQRIHMNAVFKENPEREKKKLQRRRFFQLANSKYLWTEHFLSGRKQSSVCVSAVDSRWGVLIPWAYAPFHLSSATILEKAHLSDIYSGIFLFLSSLEQHVSLACP